MILKTCIIIIFAIAISKISILLLMQLMRSAECTMLNYRGRDVVFGMGAAFVPIIMTSSILIIMLFKNELMIYISYLFSVCVMAFAGLLDDLVGDKETKGLKKHLALILRGHLTTGFIKAFLGIVSSLILSYGISKNLLDFMLNIFIISLFTNALNLLDLRPGRAVKIFIILSVILVLLNMNTIESLLPLIAMTIAASIYMKFDLKEICMLGDTGSNILGITLGYFSSFAFDSDVKTAILIILLTINIAAEKVSITKIIAKNKLLNYLDNLGRSRGL